MDRPFVVSNEDLASVTESYRIGVSHIDQQLVVAVVSLAYELLVNAFFI